MNTLLERSRCTNFFSTCQSLFGIISIAGNFRQVNAAWHKILGYSNNEIYKSLYLELVHPQDKNKTESFIEQLSAGTSAVRFTNRFRHHDGSYRDILWEATGSEVEEAFYVVGMDVTEYNTEIQMAREDFEFFMEKNREGVLDWDLVTNQVEYSSRWKNLLGYYNEEEIGTQIEAWYSRIHPSDYSKVINEIKMCLENEKNPIYNRIHRLQNREGSYRWVHSQGTVLRDKNGRAIRFLISFIDITERKRLEDALYTSEKYAKLFFFQPDAILLISQQGKILDVNPSASKLYGYTREELSGRNCSKISNDINNLSDFTSHTRYESFHKKKSGNVFPVEMMVSVWEWQTKKVFTLSVRDITPLKNEMEQLAKSEMKYRHLFEAQSEAILIFDASARKIVDVNTAATTLYGYTFTEWQHLGLENLVANPLESPSRAYLAGKQNLRNIPLEWHLKKGGSPFPVEISINHFSYNNDKLCIFIIRDVSRHKQIEDNLKKNQAFTNTLVETAPVFFLILTPDGKIVQANRILLQNLGYQLNELLNQDYLKTLVPRIEQPFVAETLNTLLKTNKPLLTESLLNTKNNNQLLVEWHYCTMEDDEYQRVNFILAVGININKRKQIHQQWRLFKKIIDNSNEAMAVLKPDGNLIYYNQAYEKIFKCPAKNIKPERNIFSRNVSADPLRRFAEEIIPLMKQGKTWEGLIEVSDTQGRRFPTWQRFDSIQDYKGNLLFLFNMFHDISQQQVLETTLRYEPQQCDIFFSVAPLAIMYMDKDSRIIRANPYFANLFKLNDEQLTGMDLEQIFPPQLANQFRAEDLEVFRTGKPKLGLIHQLQDSYFKIDKIPYHDAEDKILGIIVFAIETTGSVQTEQTLRSEYEQYQTLFNVAPLPIIYKDKENKIIKINSSAAQLWNTSPDNLINTPFKDLKPQLVFQSYQNNLEIDPVQSFQDKYYQIHQIPYPDSNDNISGTIIFLVDITQHVQTQLVLQEKHDQYETLFNAAPLAIMYKDENNRFIRVNRCAAQLWNTTPQELEGVYFNEIAPEYFSQYHANDLEVINTGEPQRDIIAEYTENSYWKVDKIPYQNTTGKILGVIIFATDITEHLRIEHLLRHKCQQFETIFHAAPLAIWYKDHHDRLIFVNQYFANLWHTHPENLEGLLFQDLEPEYATQYQESDLKVIQSGKPELGIVEEYFQIEWLVYKIPFRDEKGHLSGIIVFAMDITEQRQTEQILRQQLQQLEQTEAGLRLGIEYLPIMVCALNSEGNIALWNQKCEQVTGYHAAEIIDNPNAWEYLYPENEYREQCSNYFNLLKNYENRQQWQWTLTGKDGTQKTIAWTMNPLPFNHQKSFNNNQLEVVTELEWAIGENITEHDETLQALLESEKRLQLAIENLPMMIDALDEEGNIVLWNHECERVTGYGKAEIVGNPRAWELLYPDKIYREQMFQTQKDMLERYGGIRQWELNLTCKNGEQRTITWSVSNEVKMSGFSLWFIGQDVTDQQKLIERLCDSEERLWRLVQNMPIMLKAYDEEGTLILWNRHCEKVTGYSASEIIGFPEEIKLLYPQAKYGRSQQLRMQEETYLHCETEITCKDGSKKIIAWSNVSKQFPIPGWYSWLIGQDITVFKNAPQTCNETTVLLETALNSISIGLCITDGRGRLVYLNSAYCQLYGYYQDDLIARPFVAVIPRNNQHAELQNYFNFLSNTQKNTFSKTRRDLHRQGHLLEVQVAAYRVKQESCQAYVAWTVTKVT